MLNSIHLSPQRKWKLFLIKRPVTMGESSTYFLYTVQSFQTKSSEDQGKVRGGQWRCEMDSQCFALGMRYISTERPKDSDWSLGQFMSEQYINYKGEQQLNFKGGRCFRMYVDKLNQIQNFPGLCCSTEDNCTMPRISTGNSRRCRECNLSNSMGSRSAFCLQIQNIALAPN